MFNPTGKSPEAVLRLSNSSREKGERQSLGTVTEREEMQDRCSVAIVSDFLRQSCRLAEQAVNVLSITNLLTSK